MGYQNTHLNPKLSTLNPKLQRKRITYNVIRTTYYVSPLFPNLGNFYLRLRRKFFWHPIRISISITRFPHPKSIRYALPYCRYSDYWLAAGILCLFGRRADPYIAGDCFNRCFAARNSWRPGTIAGFVPLRYEAGHH